MEISTSGIVKCATSPLHGILNNPCETGTTTNWSLGGTVTMSSGLVTLDGNYPEINSSSFALGANDIIVFEFGVSLPKPSTTTGGPGLYLGTTYGVSTKMYYYSDNNGWVVADNGTTNPYFIHSYNSTAVDLIKTYIIGTSVNINNVPRTESSLTSHTIYVLQPLSGTSTAIRSGYNSNTAMTINLYNLKLYKINYGGVCENSGEASINNGYLSFDDYIEV